VQFLTSLSQLPATTKKRLALISGRTADNPKLMSEAIQVQTLSLALNRAKCAKSLTFFSSF
jgi:hypothetical protein